MIFFRQIILMIYCYLEDYPYADTEYEIIGFMDSENHSYDDTVFDNVYLNDSFKYTMRHILELCKLNNIEMHILNQDNNNWSFVIKKCDIDNIKALIALI